MDNCQNVEISQSHHTEIQYLNGNEMDNSITRPSPNDDKHYNDIRQQIGLMLDETVATIGQSIVYRHLCCQHCSLQDLECLKNYTNIRSLNASHNNIEDLNPVGSLTSLISLDCSYNRLTTHMNFKPLLWLQEVNLSFNRISALPDLAGFVLLTKLNISHNGINDLKAVQLCRNLKYLDASFNQLRDFTAMHQSSLTQLMLSNNQLTSMAGFGSLVHLRFLDVSCNQLRTFNGMCGLYALRHLVGCGNESLRDLAEMRHLKHLHSLNNLDLRGCPVRQASRYVDSVVFHAFRLQLLDQRPVSPCRREQALPDRLIDAAAAAVKDHAELFLAKFSRSRGCGTRAPHASKQDHQQVFDSNIRYENYTEATTKNQVPPHIKEISNTPDEENTANTSEKFAKSTEDDSDLQSATFLESSVKVVSGISNKPVERHQVRWQCVALVGPPGSGKRKLIDRLLSGPLKRMLLRATVISDGNPKQSNWHSVEANTKDTSLDSACFIHVSSDHFSRIKQCGGLAATFTCFNTQTGVSEASVEMADKNNVMLLLSCDLSAGLSLQRRLPRTQLVLVLPLNRQIHRKRLEAETFVRKNHQVDSKVDCMKTELVSPERLDSNKLELITCGSDLFVESRAESETNLESGKCSARDVSSSTNDVMKKTNHKYQSEPPGLYDRDQSPALDYDMLTQVDSELSACSPEEAENNYRLPDINRNIHQNDHFDPDEMKYSAVQIDSIMRERNCYIQLHNTRPGLFVCCVNSDHLETASETLHQLLHQALQEPLTPTRQKSDAKHTPVMGEMKKCLLTLMSHDSCHLSTTPSRSHVQ